MHRYIKYSLVSLIAFLGGFYVCILIKKISSLSISNSINFEVNPLEVFSVIITVLLAIYVTRTLSKQNDKEKEEKLLLVKYFKDLKDLINFKLEKILEQENYDTQITKSDLKVLRKKLNSFIQLAEKYKFIQANDEISVKLKENLTDIWELLTDTPKKVNGRANTEVKQGIESIRIERKSSVETKVVMIDELIFELIIKINEK